MSDLLVGHGACPLDVPMGTALGGYLAREAGATGTLDPLEVAAVVLRRGDETAVVCVADVLAVDGAVADDVRRAVAAEVATDPALVWLAATHTHAGPSPVVVSTLVGAAVGAARDAVGSVQPADVLVHRGELEGVGGQRSGAERRTTTPVSAVAVRRPGSAAVLGVLTVVACHPTVLDANNREVSADLGGAVRRSVTRRVPGAWAVAATGAAGDMSTRPHRRGQTPEELDRLGDVVGEQVADMLSSPPVARSAGPRLVGRHEVVELPAKAPRSPAESAAVLARAEAALAEARCTGDPRSARDAVVAQQGAQLVLDATGDGSPVACHVAALDLAGVRLVGVGGEPFVALGDRCPDAVLVGYANGYCGYLPTADAYGRDDYEVLVARVAAGGAERAVDAAAALL